MECSADKLSFNVLLCVTETETKSTILISVVWNLGIMITKGMLQNIQQHNNCGNINVHSNINTLRDAQ